MMMRNNLRWVVAASIAAALAVAGVTLSGALTARRAAHEAALEADVLSANIAFLETRLAADSLNWLLSGHLADLYTERFRAGADLRDVQRAELLTRASLPIRIERAGAYARLSGVLLTQHRFDEAYHAARLAVNGPHPPAAALAALVDAARAVGDDAAADSALARIDRSSFAATVRMADRFAGEGRNDAAVRAVSRACERLRETGATRELRAWCYTKLAALEHHRSGATEARSWLRYALALQPQHRGASEMLADLAYAQQRWREAKRYYERIATAAHPDLYLRLAEVNRALGRPEIAAANERRFLSLASDPQLETLYALPLALYYAESGRCTEAGGLAERELTRRRSAEAWEGVAWVRFKCGDSSGAAAALGQAAAASTLSPSANYLQGLLRHAAGDLAAANVLIARATSDPTQLEPHVLQHLRRNRGVRS